jgi:hypothetical protein
MHPNPAKPEPRALSPEPLAIRSNEDYQDGLLPQDPPGKLVVLKMVGLPAWWKTTDVDLTGLAATAPEDPEPEFVDINDRNQAMVSLQENNHFAIVDLRRAPR